MALELANPINSTGNPYNDLYTLPTLAGACLDFFAGVTYIAPTSKPNFVCCTPAMNAEKMDIRANVVAGFPDAVTMIKHVADGLFVGTTGGAYFLAGLGFTKSDKGNVTGGFTQVRVSKMGVLPGSDVYVDGALVKGAPADKVVVMWLSPMGVCMGAPGGNVVNLSDPNARTPFGSTTRGAAYINSKSYGVDEYVVVLGDVTWVLNLQSLGHTRYTNYVFNSFAQLNGVWYGSNDSGIFALGGGTDDGAQIAAYVLTPASDMGTMHNKVVRDIYLAASVNGRARFEVITNRGSTPVLDFQYPPGRVISDAHDAESTAKIRGKVPRKIVGNNWQFKISNTMGSPLYLRMLRAQATACKRSN